MAILKLNQLLADEKGVKNRAENFFTETLRNLAKPDLLSGLNRTYDARRDGDEIFPSETKRVQVKAEDEIKKLSALLADLFDTTAKKDRTNCEAFADVRLDDGTVLLTKVPVTHLLFLEKKLNDLLAFVRKAPTLDPSEDWQRDETTGFYKTAPTQTFKTRKRVSFVEASPATPAHPAQVKEVANDEIVGTWTQIKHSGALTATRVELLVSRVEKLQRAVKYARAQANCTPVIEELKSGEVVMKYIFG